MGRKRKSEKPITEVRWEESDDHGDDEQVSLDKLSEAFAGLIQSHEEPSATSTDEAKPTASNESEPAPVEVPWGDGEAIAPGEVTVHGIVEAMLFVGHPQNLPLPAEQMAALIRGTEPEEIAQIVQQLNQTYHESQAAYEIIEEPSGFRLALRDEFIPVRNRFYGKMKEAKLSQAAIEVLALVAYNEPLTAEQVNQSRNTNSGAILSQLVRRKLLRIERTDSKPRETHYYTTKRFLALFGLSSLADLPQIQEIE